MEKKQYDVGLVGWWHNSNYGSMLTYYALHQTLKNLGYSVLMIHEALGYPNRVKWDYNNPPHKFAKEHYDFREQVNYDELRKYNDECNTFIVGSDQLWNPHIKRVNSDCFLDFTADDKKRISYGTSFGNEGVLESRPEFVKANYDNLRRFDAISVREDYAVKVAEDNFNVKAVRVVDPVFLPDISEYTSLAEQASHKIDGEYMLAFILDPTEAKKDVVLKLAEKLGYKKIFVLTDPFQSAITKAEQIFNASNMEMYKLEQISPENFLCAYQNAGYVITDSLHGMCFSYIFRKNFNVFYNILRGAGRFASVVGLMGLESRRIYEDWRTEPDTSAIDFAQAEKSVNELREYSLNWLKTALDTPKELMPKIILNNLEKKPEDDDNVAELIKNMHIDVKRCKMVATLLRDYGVKHIVISSGSRHADLVRFFENNSCFITHNVIDERSAGFYALGLATKMRAPVAVCCTSGTASSNYLTSMSEAFYQHVPLIYITADRYPHLLNQREDQMVPQDNMYGRVCLKSVTLIPKDDPNTTAAMRREVCETILEATHNQFGPVHINIPVAFVNIKPLPAKCYDLEQSHFPLMQRYKFLPDRSSWNSVLDTMKKNKILIIYGQNYKLSHEDHDAFDKFCKRFNCAFYRENLSNFTCTKSINGYNMVKKSGNVTDTMLKEIKPDIVITMFGSTVAITRDFLYKFKTFEHWDIAPNGAAADPYKKLTKIFECTPIQFIKRLNFMAGDASSVDSYFQSWKKYEIINDIIPEKYSQRYATYQILEKMPENALLHLANSNTVRFACSYKIKENISVYCNRGTNGIDGSASTFIGQAALSKEPCYLLIGDLSFFYDMNSLWNKKLGDNIRIVLFNNYGAGALRDRKAKAIVHSHQATARGWVESLGFTYLSSRNMDEFNANIDRFVSNEDSPMFFEVFC